MPFVPGDSELVSASRRGDQLAFATLVDRHYGVLVASCRQMLGDAEEARDAAQEAVLRGLLGLDHLRDDTRFGSWLVGIGLNVCRGLISKRGSRARSVSALQRVAGLLDPLAEQCEPIELITAGELATSVQAALTALPAGQRQAVALFYLSGLTHAEIAAEIGTQPGAIKTRLYKARKTLRTSLLTTYQEHFEMTDQAAELVPMHVAELRRTATPNAGDERHILFLQDDGDRRLPIWIGRAEATAMAIALERVALPRPGVYQFAAALLTGAGSQLREVRVTELTASTFYAQAILTDGTSIDARPSDALTLALVTEAPIYVAAEVLKQAEQSRPAFSDLHDEANAAPDDAHVIADEVKASYAAALAELATRRNPST
jgi:RNA polymerase sigma factor (sigma-70 family)